MIGYLRQFVEGRKPKVSRAEVLGARPVRNPLVEWERILAHEEGPWVVFLRVPRRADRWGNFVARVFRMPSHRKIELDEMGSDVWEMCDGDLTVDALTKAVCAKYHLNRRQGEASVTAYMRMLAERRLLALRTGARKNEAPAVAAGPRKSRRRRR
uniref:PqqD family protein n=1 Tax=uncultured Armatimonadetes bacterium TaxID=157466 RepID=A0A6J4K8P3_9BACT|nr:hypothetical protein AVDCRST_MAG63-5031 [uncultured Armatimonadetes bacterium]